MKVLWLTNSLMPDHAAVLGQEAEPTGGWMPSLAAALAKDGRLELAVATNVRGSSRRIETASRVKYYTIPMPGRNVQGGKLPSKLIEDYQQVVADFHPDVLHVHGTEYFHGLLTGRGYLRVPTVISIQGILDVCVRNYLDGIPLNVIFRKRTLRDWIRFDGLIEQKCRWLRRAAWEREIFASNSAFIGRTLWDHAHLKRLNPAAQYFHCDEVIREPFHKVRWDINKATRHRIFCSSASYPLKGFHVLLKAVALLKDEFPDTLVRTPLAHFYPTATGWLRFWKNCRSMGYVRYLTDMIHDEKLEANIMPISSLDAEGMAKELMEARVFVLPSSIENSPNSLAEAMLVGTPTVAAYVGGVPSMARDGESALLFPSGDEAILAEQLRRLFLDDNLARGISDQARAVALERHSVPRIVNKMVEIYQAIADGNA